MYALTIPPNCTILILFELLLLQALDTFLNYSTKIVEYAGGEGGHEEVKKKMIDVCEFEVKLSKVIITCHDQSNWRCKFELLIYDLSLYRNYTYFRQ